MVSEIQTAQDIWQKLASIGAFTSIPQKLHLPRKVRGG